jgi:hypothetical protein
MNEAEIEVDSAISVFLDRRCPVDTKVGAALMVSTLVKAMGPPPKARREKKPLSFAFR